MLPRARTASRGIGHTSWLLAQRPGMGVILNPYGKPVTGMSLNINGNGPKFQLQLWRIYVEGSEPRGMNTSVEAAAAALWGS